MNSKELISQATKTGLYKKIHYDNCDSIERFKCMVEDNNIYSNYNNEIKNKNDRFLENKKVHYSNSEQKIEIDTNYSLFLYSNYNKICYLK